MKGKRSQRSPRPRVFLDTNAGRFLKARPATELSRFWTWLEARYEYAISPLVIAETLKSLKDDAARHLEDVRRELCALRGPGHPVFMSLPGIFIGQHLYGMNWDHPIASAREMASVFEAGRRLKRIHRSRGLVYLAESPERQAICLNHIIDPVFEGQQSMFDALATTRGTRGTPYPRDEWAERPLKQAAIEAIPERVTRLAEACQAAFDLQDYLWDQALGNYNWKKHPGDWMDKQFLLYLARPDTFFASCERRLPRLIPNSKQADRILLVDDLWDASQT